MSDPKFILLKQGVGWVQGEHLWDTLGAVIKNYLSPGDEAIPEKTNRFAKGLNEMEFDNFVLRKDAQATPSTSLSAPGFFELQARRENLQGLDLSGKRVLVKRLRKHPEVWSSMMAAEPAVMATVQQWLADSASKRRWVGKRQSAPAAFWVTGVLLCQDVHIAATSTDAKHLRARGEIPIGTCASLAGAAAAGSLPLNLVELPNIVGERAKVTLESQCFAADANGTHIFALELRQVLLGKKGDQEQLIHSDLQLKIPKNRQLNKAESADVQETLETVELDDEMWDLLLAD